MTGSDLDRIRRYLRTQEIVIRWLSERSGYTCPDMETIYVNPAWELARVLVHESYHHLYPDWDETQVETATLALVNGLTPRQALGLAKRCQGIVWTALEEPNDLA